MLTAEVRGMHYAAYILALSALASAVLALVRDRMLAHTFGAGAMLDTYYAAFRIPDLIFVTVASLFSAYVLIPELSRRSSGPEARGYIDTIAIGFAVIIGCMSVVAFVAAPYLLTWLFPAIMASEWSSTLLLMTRVLLVQPILLGFSNILAAVTQYSHRYILYALAPILYNIGIILGVLAYPRFGIYSIVFGVLLGACLHAGVQLPFVMRDGYFVRFARLESLQSIAATIKVSLPRTFALSMTTVVTVGLIAAASRFFEGSVSVFAFALNLYAVPLSIIGASYSVAAFPELSRKVLSGDTESFVAHVSDAARHILFWSLPATALLIVLRAHVVRAVLGSGAFDWTDTRLTAATLALLSFALVAQALMLLLARSYYAAGKSYVPVYVNAAMVAGTALTAFAMTHAVHDRFILTFIETLLRVSDVPGAAMLALPLAYSIGAVGATIAIVVRFNHEFRGFIRRIARTFWESITAAGFVGAGAYMVLEIVGGISPATTFMTVLLHAVSAGLVGILVGSIAYALLGSRELSEIAQSLVRRVAPSKPLSSAEEQVGV